MDRRRGNQNPYRRPKTPRSRNHIPQSPPPSEAIDEWYRGIGTTASGAFGVSGRSFGKSGRSARRLFRNVHNARALTFAQACLISGCTVGFIDNVYIAEGEGDCRLEETGKAGTVGRKMKMPGNSGKAGVFFYCAACTHDDPQGWLAEGVS
ncbi:hypothetical protein BHM03_00013251 [Ensete ventricosum]|nr:hypothetical protein BHM03_00013251 [Ensete ventricosum]